MSNNKNIYEALYASSDGVVVPRHKSAALPAAMLFIGGILVAATFLTELSLPSRLLSTIGLVGGELIFAGAISLLVRIYGAGRPFHTGEGRFLKVEELRFAKDKSAEVARLVREGDFDALRALRHDGVSAVTATLFTSPAGTFRACQAFEFIDLEMRPICDLKIVRG